MSVQVVLFIVAFVFGYVCGFVHESNKRKRRRQSATVTAGNQLRPFAVVRLLIPVYNHQLFIGDVGTVTHVTFNRVTVEFPGDKTVTLWHSDVEVVETV